MTVEKMKQIIIDSVPFTQLEKNKGIYEFHIEGGISLGESYEDIDDKKDIYIYNIFIGSEYINICGEGTKEEPLPNNVLSELVKEWNSIHNKERIRNVRSKGK